MKGETKMIKTGFWVHVQVWQQRFQIFLPNSYESKGGSEKVSSSVAQEGCCDRRYEDLNTRVAKAN